MRNIILARVDDRLIHGEVVTSWIPFTKANAVIVVDDEIANDVFNKRVLKALSPSGVSMEIYSVDEAVDVLNGEEIKGELVIVLAKTPTTFERLIVENKVDIKSVNIGGMGIRGERKPFFKNCSASPDEVASIKNMKDKGIDVYYQLIAENGKMSLDEAINGYK